MLRGALRTSPYRAAAFGRALMENPLMRAAGLPKTTRPYDLRHTFATLMLEQGENPKVVQEVLGHSRITHTMDTYSHVSPNIQKEAFGRLGKRLEGP